MLKHLWIVALCAAPLWAEEVSESFDPPPPGWILDDPQGGAGWAFDMTPATFPSGVSRSGNSLNFNNGVDYQGCSCGSALTPPLTLSDVTNPVLKFWCNYNCETRGTDFDRRYVEVWTRDGKTRLAQWQLATVGYSFDSNGGVLGRGPGPCKQAYIDAEDGIPVDAWHEHTIHLDPAWDDVRVRFVFWSVDDQRNGYAGWAIDDFAIASHPSAPPNGFPDATPDTTLLDGDGNELDICERDGNLLKFASGTSNLGDPGIHLVFGDHPDSILDISYLFFDNHLHFSQYSEFALWEDVSGVGLVKVRRRRKPSFCLTDSDQVGPGPSVSPGCSQRFQAISYNWQDVYRIGTTLQNIDLDGLPTGTNYLLVQVIDPLNRFRETSDENQVDQIHFMLPAGDGQVPILDRINPYPQSATPLSITSATVGQFNGKSAVQVIGAGFDTALLPFLFDANAAESVEAFLYTIVSATEIWVDIPAGVATPASIDILRASGHAASARLLGGAPTPCPAPGPPAFVTATVANPVNTKDHLTFQFNGVGEAVQGLLEHRWNFGDGTAVRVFVGIASGAATEPEHSYVSAGTYTVTFTTEDDQGNLAERTLQVQVFVPSGGGGALGLEVLLLLVALGARRFTRRR